MVRVNDYTKNISQTIFSPGLSKVTSRTGKLYRNSSLVVRSSKSRQQPRVRRSLIRDIEGAPRAKGPPSHKSLRSIRSGLSEEKARKRKLAEEIKHVRNTFKDLLK